MFIFTNKNKKTFTSFYFYNYYYDVISARKFSGYKSLSNLGWFKAVFMYCEVFFVSLGVVQSALCKQAEVSELVESLEQSGERPQCPCSPSRATLCNSNSLLMVQNSFALQALRSSLQPYTPENTKG